MTDDTLRRLAREAATGDTRAALDHARALERAGRISEALEALSSVPLSGELVGELVSRSARQVVESLARLPERRCRRVAAVLVEAGAWAPLVVLGCDPRTRPVVRSEVLLALAGPVFLELPFLVSLTPRHLVEGIGGCRCGDTSHGETDGLAGKVLVFADARARSEPRAGRAVVPWIAALAALESGAIAEAARRRFHDLTGQRRVPLAVEPLAERWKPGR